MTLTHLTIGMIRRVIASVPTRRSQAVRRGREQMPRQAIASKNRLSGIGCESRTSFYDAPITRLQTIGSEGLDFVGWAVGDPLRNCLVTDVRLDVLRWHK